LVENQATPETGERTRRQPVVKGCNWTLKQQSQTTTKHYNYWTANIHWCVRTRLKISRVYCWFNGHNLPDGPVHQYTFKGLFDYRIRIRIQSESRFRFTWQIE